MSKIYLKTLYARIYHENFSYTESEKRIKMQMAIYLLQEMGAPIGDYSFFWYKHELYSKDLQDTMYTIKNISDGNIVKFSTDMEKDITRIEKVLSENGLYSQSQWTECMASIYYLQNIFFHSEQQMSKFVKNCVIENLILIMIMKINAL